MIFLLLVTFLSNEEVNQTHTVSQTNMFSVHTFQLFDKPRRYRVIVMDARYELIDTVPCGWLSPLEAKDRLSLATCRNRLTIWSRSLTPDNEVVASMTAVLSFHFRHFQLGY